MKPSKLLTLLFLLHATLAFGHQDFWMIQNFGNVKVRIKTGFQFEEIAKSWIIGELAHRLCQQLHYSKPVFIDLDHIYVRDCEPDYFLSFDKGTIINTWDTEKPKPFLKHKSLVIREVSRRFSPAVTLQLVEYAIRNAAQIKSTQKMITYAQNYSSWKINSIDTVLVKKIASGRPSEMVVKTLSTKVYRSENEKFSTDISYYFQNNQYHIFYNDHKVKDSVLLTLDNIYQFEYIPSYKAVVFDTDHSFYFVEGTNNPHVSQRKEIENISEHYSPFEIKQIGSNKVAFSFYYFDKTEWNYQRERTILYRSDKDEVVQDLDKRLDEKQ